MLPHSNWLQCSSHLGSMTLAAVLFLAASSTCAQTSCSTAVALNSIGITPKVLCVAGATSNDTSALLSQLTSTDELSAYVQARASLSVATEGYTNALAEVSDSSGHSDSVDALMTARTQLLSAQSAFSSARSELIALATSLLPNQVATNMQSIQANISRGLPAEYAGLTLSEPQSRSLALAIRAAASEAPPSWATDLVFNYHSQAEVLNAASRLASLLDAIDQNFNCD